MRSCIRQRVYELRTSEYNLRPIKSNQAVKNEQLSFDDARHEMAVVLIINVSIISTNEVNFRSLFKLIILQIDSVYSHVYAQTTCNSLSRVRCTLGTTERLRLRTSFAT